MTSTQPISVRLTTDQRAALAAAAQQRHIGASTLASAIIGGWLDVQAVPVEQQAWYRAGHLASMARDRIDHAKYGATDSDVLNAVECIIKAVELLAGTAPECSPAGGQ